MSAIINCQPQLQFQLIWPQDKSSTTGVKGPRPLPFFDEHGALVSPRVVRGKDWWDGNQADGKGKGTVIETDTAGHVYVR